MTYQYETVGGGDPGDYTVAPVFPNVYIGVAAAFGAALFAYTFRKRLIRQA